MAVSLGNADYREYFSTAKAGLLAALTGATQFSISFWGTIVTGAFDRDHELVTWGPHAASTLGWLFWRDDSDTTFGRSNTVSGLTYPPEHRVVAATGSWNDTNWYHWVYTWLADSATGQKLYRNGVQDVNTGSTVGHASLTGYASNPVRIGNVSGTVSSANYFHGMMDDIRLYSRVLTPNEVMSIFTRRGTDDIVDGLLLRYLLQDKAPGQNMDATADAVKDSGEFSYHATADGGYYPTYVESAILSGIRRRSA